ncbi:MAG: hypothetical protein IPH09_15970 [bacterium]|nr:hypothetical protein [bacterium]
MKPRSLSPNVDQSFVGAMWCREPWLSARLLTSSPAASRRSPEQGLAAHAEAVVVEVLRLDAVADGRADLGHPVGGETAAQAHVQRAAAPRPQQREGAVGVALGQVVLEVEAGGAPVPVPRQAGVHAAAVADQALLRRGAVAAVQQVAELEDGPVGVVGEAAVPAQRVEGVGAVAGVAAEGEQAGGAGFGRRRAQDQQREDEGQALAQVHGVATPREFP